MAGVMARRALREVVEQHGSRGLSLARTLTEESVRQGQNRVVDASLTLIRERARLKVGLSTTASQFLLSTGFHMCSLLNCFGALSFGR